MKNKTLSILLAVLMSMAASVASAHDFEVDGIYYNITSSTSPRTVSVTYRGSSYNSYYDEYSGNVIIPESVMYDEITYSVTSIGNSAFEICYGLTSVTIPESVTSIDWNAFYYCDGLTFVTIPNSVTSIGEAAFSGCSGLTSVTIGNSVTSIGGYAFSGCSGLESLIVDAGNTVYDSRNDCNAIIETASNTLIAGCKNTIIPNSVTSIGSYAFSDCYGLTSVTIPNSVTSIGEWAFAFCSGLTSVTIPESVTSIVGTAFSACSGLESLIVDAGNTVYDSRNDCNAIIETVSNTLVAGCKNTVIPNSVTSIGQSAFEYCSGLTSVTIPNSVTSIGNWAFDGCTGLTSITIPESVTSIGTAAFQATTWFENQPDGLVYAGKVAYKYKGTMPAEIVLEEGTVGIAGSAFFYCSGLTSVTIPNSVTSIGSYAFRSCSGLTDVYCYAETVPTTNYYAFYETPVSNATLHVPAASLDNYAATAPWSGFGSIVALDANIVFADANVKALCVANWDTNSDGELSEAEAASVTSLGGVFRENKAINSFDELQYFTGLTSIGDHAFYGCDGLTSVTIPNSVTSIGNWAFFDCYGLSSVIFSEGITSIGDGSFGNCESLTSVTIPNSVTSIGESAFSGCCGLESIIVDAGNTVYDSRNDCNAIIETASNTLIAGCKNTVIPNSVTSIGRSAFSGCRSLTSITIPWGVSSIDSYAFEACENLTSVTIPNSLISIGADVFYNCRSLTVITIPESVTSIGIYAFVYCDNLTDVYCYTEDILAIPGNVFNNTPVSNATLHVPMALLDDYAATAPWSGFGTIVPIESSFALTDGESYTNDTDTDYDEISYTRNFSNTNWQALYVPFEMSYDDWKDDFVLARINDTHQWDDNDDGVIDRTELEVIKIRSGQTEANTPYLIRAKSKGEKTITVTDATLYAAEERSYDVSSWNTLYTFTGTYTGVPGATMLGNGYYAFGGGTLHQAADATNALSPFRWYMAITDRQGNPKNLGEVKVLVFDMEDETDGITPIDNGPLGPQGRLHNEEEQELTMDIYYDLSGRRVTNPRQGIYVKNGSKVVIK